MTAIPLTLSTGISQRFTEDTALSDSARELYGLFVEATSFSESISLGHLRETGREELLRAYLDAQQDNWDGEGALAADPASLKYAIHFLDLLPSFILNPDASVDPDGEMNLEWYSGPQSVFSVSIGRDGNADLCRLVRCEQEPRCRTVWRFYSYHCGREH